jgi:hypothetical protein
MTVPPGQHRDVDCTWFHAGFPSHAMRAHLSRGPGTAQGLSEAISMASGYLRRRLPRAGNAGFPVDLPYGQ